MIYHEISKEKNLNKINSDVVSILYNNKESKVVKMIEQYAYYLSIGVNNAIMLYAPELVIFNSPLTKKIPDIINIIQRNPVISGAISLSIQKFLNIEQLKLGKLNKI